MVPQDPPLRAKGVLQRLRVASGGLPILGGIFLKDVLGEGGCGTVFKGWHSRLGIPVAVKVLIETEFGAGSTFLNEARLAAQVEHPNVVRVYDVNHDHGYVYIVQEYVPGVTVWQLLSDARQRGLPTPEARVLELALDIARGLAAIHDAGILHLDIKLNNILIRQRDGLAKILDLGLARALRGVSGAAPTIQSSGTLGYSSPEQLLHAPCTPASDVYSLGVVLYEILANCLAFPQKEDAAVVSAQMTAPWLNPRDVRPEVNAEFAEIITRCTACNPDDRWKNAGELLQALSRLSLARQNPQAAVEEGGARYSGRLVHVDDDPEQRELVADLLRPHGYETTGFATGQEALGYLAQQEADLVLLDLTLERENGLDVCRQIRGLPGCAGLPVVFLSGVTQGEIIEQALAEGGVDYLAKPVNPADLFARVQCLARLSQIRRERTALEATFSSLARAGLDSLLKGQHT